MDNKQNIKKIHHLHKIVALTFLKPNQVISGFERLLMEVGDDFEMILNSFEELCIGKIFFVQLNALTFYCLRRNNIKRKALFSIDFWNIV